MNKVEIRLFIEKNTPIAISNKEGSKLVTPFRSIIAREHTINCLVDAFDKELNRFKCNAPKSFLPCNVRDNGKCNLPTHCDYQRKK